MKVGISAWSYRWFFNDGKMTYPKFLDEVKRKGADGFEIFPHYLDQRKPAKHLKEIMKKAGRLRLQVSTLIAANDFAHATAAERAEEVQKMKMWIEAAADAGIKRLNVFTGYHRDGQDPTMETMRVIDSFREVAPLAQKRKVLLCIENHSSVHRDADGLLSIIHSIGSPVMRANPDPTNFCPGYRTLDEKARKVIYSETAKFAPLMSNAHLKLSEFDEKGDAKYVDVLRVLRIFKRAGYTGQVVIEFAGQGDPRDSIAKGIAQLRRLFRKL